MKTTELALNFLQKNQTAKPLVPPAPGTINAFHSLFSVQDLDDLENQTIETILQSGIESGSLEKELSSDAHEIKRLTKELRAIRRQELVLIGERVSAARDVFRKYKDRSFRDWMQLTFGSFKTGYNYLAFYDLYLSVPDEIKIRLKDMPAKAVYVLASHKAPLEKKKSKCSKTTCREKLRGVFSLQSAKRLGSLARYPEKRRTIGFSLL